MNFISNYRRENLRRLIKENGGPLALATKLGYTNSSFLVQMVGPSPIREVSERTARSYEKQLGLDTMSLDKEVDVTVYDSTRTMTSRRRNLPADKVPDTMSVSDIGKLIQMIGAICESEEVNLPQAKFADIITLVLVDAAAHGNAPREEYICQLVRLTK